MQSSRCLDRARAAGFLDVMNGSALEAMRAYGTWCWKMRIPLIWAERLSRRSKFAIVRLDLLTTAHLLSAAGQAELDGLGRALGIAECSVTPHQATWAKVPLSRVEQLARSAYRIATRPGNYELRKPAPDLELVHMFETIQQRMEAAPRANTA